MILSLETATKNCSVALITSEGTQFELAEYSDKFIHGERLHLLIKELMDKASVGFSDLSGVCVTKGPGSYTGLRIGVSAAKGICYALKLPLYSVPTLSCWDFKEVESTKIISVIDARRDEVYAQKWEATHGLWQPLGPVHAEVITTQSWSSWSQESVVVLGECADKVRELHKNSGWSYLENSFPSASNITYGEIQQEDVAYFEPFYLKDFVALKSSKKLL